MAKNKGITGLDRFVLHGPTVKTSAVKLLIVGLAGLGVLLFVADVFNPYTPDPIFPMTPFFDAAAVLIFLKIIALFVPSCLRVLVDVGEFRAAPALRLTPTVSLLCVFLI